MVKRCVEGICIKRDFTDHSLSTDPTFIHVYNSSWSGFVRKELEFSWRGEKCLEIILHPISSSTYWHPARGAVCHLRPLLTIPAEQVAHDTLGYPGGPGQGLTTGGALRHGETPLIYFAASHLLEENVSFKRGHLHFLLIIGQLLRALEHWVITFRPNL